MARVRRERDLDQVDRKILRELQRDARVSNVELAARVNLSPTPCLERVRRLEREGYIKRYVTLLEPSRLKASLLVFVEITLTRTTSDVFGAFRDAVVRLPEVLECHMVAGGFDYLLKIRVEDMKAYRQVLGHMLDTLPGIRETHTYVVMEELKEVTEIPVPDAQERTVPERD